MEHCLENLCVRCSPADPEIMDRLRSPSSRGAPARPDPDGGRGGGAMCVTVSRAGIGEENADLLGDVAVRHGPWRVEENAE